MRIVKKIFSKLIARILLPLLKSSAIRRELFNSMKSGEFLASSISNEIFVVSSTDKIIGRDVYAYGSYDFKKLEKVINFLPENHSHQTIVDIGANIGTICIPAIKRKIFKKGIGVEPDPLNFRLLKGNVVLNALEDSIELHNVALAAQKGTAILEISPNNLGDHRIRPVDLANRKFKEQIRSTITVSTSTLDDVCGDLNADDSLIWIDTQGYEGFVLQGGQRCLAKQIPIVLEFWPSAMRQSGSYDALKKSILDADYQTLIDLSTFAKVQLTNQALDDLYNSFSSERSFTDILILKNKMNH